MPISFGRLLAPNCWQHFSQVLLLLSAIGSSRKGRGSWGGGDKDKDSVAARSNRHVCACLLPGGCSSISICSLADKDAAESEGIRREREGSKKEE